VNIYSEVPPGASTGTSAAVSVALIGALDRLVGGSLTAHEVAKLAHTIETEKLGLQSGVQDQLSSAYGGLNFIKITQFPHSSVSPVSVPNSVWWELEHRLALVYIGSPHSSSAIHKMVIAGLGEHPENDPRLEELRVLAAEAKAAVMHGDMERLGAVMNENTGVQRRLHPGLVCARFEEVISIGRRFGACGFKVNGAGGDGGSMAILTDGDTAAKRSMLSELGRKGYTSIPVYLSRMGLRVW